MSEYRDLKNNVYKVTERVLGEDDKKPYTEEEIVEQLMKIFAKNKR